jgi:hypothetical protein
MTGLGSLRQLFEAEGEKAFRLLILEYGCGRPRIRRTSYSVDITYKNATTGIKVSLEPRENLVIVYLIRLADGEIPSYLDSPSSWHYLDTIIALRAPTDAVKQKLPDEQLTASDVERILTEYADALRKYGDDVLRGDFSVFGELDRRLHDERCRQLTQGSRSHEPG